ncbi:MAG: ferritin-like domain-containing protein [Actinobacteria bacterium]|nr:ferritin-like domain-containing protein [Actinomycetota bacterium]
MTIDDKALSQLMEESQDIQSDSMKASRLALHEMVDAGLERKESGDEDPARNAAFAARRSGLLRIGMFGVGALAAAGFGAALAALSESQAFAQSATDVQVLQTQASIEVIAISTYKTALTLPFIGGSSANPVVKAFAQTTMAQHEEHLKAFNASVLALGGKAQNSPDPQLVPIVNAAVAKITGPSGVVALALELEQGAAQTYLNDLPAIEDHNARKLTASVMGVEAQHASVLLAVQALLNGGAPQLIALPTDLAALPSAAGSVGFPDAFYPTSGALSMTAGAIR